MISRRCLICANVNPCHLHSEGAQENELRRNDEAIRRIQAEKHAHDMAKLKEANPHG